MNFSIPKSIGMDTYLSFPHILKPFGHALETLWHELNRERNKLAGCKNLADEVSCPRSESYVLSGSDGWKVWIHELRSLYQTTVNQEIRDEENEELSPRPVNDKTSTF
jgi:hypothetical protein